MLSPAPADSCDIAYYYFGFFELGGDPIRQARSFHSFKQTDYTIPSTFHTTSELVRIVLMSPAVGLGG